MILLQIVVIENRINQMLYYVYKYQPTVSFLNLYLYYMEKKHSINI